MTGDFGYVFAHIADQFTVNAVDSYVDDRGAGLNHVGRDEASDTDGGYENVRLSCECRQIARAAMDYRDSGIASRRKRRARLLHEDQRQRLADDIATADDDDVLARGSDSIPIQ